MALFEAAGDLLGGVAKAAGYAVMIYYLLQWYLSSRPGGTQLPPMLVSYHPAGTLPPQQQAQAQQQAQQQGRGKKDKRAKTSAKGLGSGLGPAEPSEIEPADDEEKAQPNKVMPCAALRSRCAVSVALHRLGGASGRSSAAAARGKEACHHPAEPAPHSSPAAPRLAAERHIYSAPSR
jgi:hypothetical protein